jgi:hypothetical protein
MQNENETERKLRSGVNWQGALLQTREHKLRSGVKARGVWAKRHETNEQ